MMGFGASALVVGKLAAALIDGPGWRTAYLTVGIALAAVLAVTALVLRLPGTDVSLPAVQKKSISGEEDFEQKDFTTAEMLRRPSFWQALLGIICLAAVGNPVISFARDLALTVGAQAALATTLVGVLSMCNGLGRIVVGALFDRLGRKRTMLLANILTILAAGVTLIAVLAFHGDFQTMRQFIAALVILPPLMTFAEAFAPHSMDTPVMMLSGYTVLAGICCWGWF